jgi:hypothetical protein
MVEELEAWTESKAKAVVERSATVEDARIISVVVVMGAATLSISAREGDPWGISEMMAGRKLCRGKAVAAAGSTTNPISRAESSGIISRLKGEDDVT